MTRLYVDRYSPRLFWTKKVFWLTKNYINISNFRHSITLKIALLLAQKALFYVPKTLVWFFKSYLSHINLWVFLSFLLLDIYQLHLSGQYIFSSFMHKSHAHSSCENYRKNVVERNYFHFRISKLTCIYCCRGRTPDLVIILLIQFYWPIGKFRRECGSRICILSIQSFRTCTK